ncbi:MAG TPA: hypothetical protein VLB79_11550 [Solirubrobacterales bacterium]|nr:hypothetical protein [Solirubrobacterales bacterium]
MRREELWGRRSVAVGALLVALALIGGIVLLVAGGDGNDSSPGAMQTTADLTHLQDRFLDRTVVDPDKGISIRRPANWDVTKKHGVTNVQSKDHCLVIQLSAPVPSGKADELRKDGVTVLRDRYRNAKVQPGARSRIGGVPTTSSTITVRYPKGNDVRVLLSVGTGKQNAYLSEVVVRDPSCQGDLQLAQLMLSSAEFTK